MIGMKKVLVTQSSYYGSIAAIRALGRAGFEVIAADSSLLSPGLYSRYVSKRLRSPDPRNMETFKDWLLYLGRNYPGMIVYPTSDDVCWVLARYKQELSENLVIEISDLPTIYTLLNKERLQAALATLGLPQAETFASVEDVKNEDFPVMLKPKSQMGFLSKNKGCVCKDHKQLRRKFAEYSNEQNFHVDLTAYDPEINIPLIQKFYTSAATHMLSVGGYYSRGHIHCLFSKKIFQRPRNLGVGIAFEQVGAIDEIQGQLVALIQSVGFDGVFEAEFIQSNETWLLVDFNPRYYGQMQFEISRGLNSPVRVIADSVNNSVYGQNKVKYFANSWILRLLLYCQGFAGRISKAEKSKWIEWLMQNGVVDIVFDKEDMMPAFFDYFSQIGGGLRHPRDFYRKFFTDA